MRQGAYDKVHAEMVRRLFIFVNDRNQYSNSIGPCKFTNIGGAFAILSLSLKTKPYIRPKQGDVSSALI